MKIERLSMPRQQQKDGANNINHAPANIYAA
jgi:hypothetical protein